MGRTPSIDAATGERLLAAYQRLGSQRKAAAEVGVSKDAASRFFATLPTAAAPAMAAQQELVATTGARLWETRSALQDNYDRIQKLLAQLDTGIVQQGGEWVTLTPIATHVAAIREAREHIRTAVDLGKLLLDIEQVRAFQQAVIEAIGEADPATRERLIAKLRERRAVGLAP